MVNLASGERAPGEPFAWLLLDDLGIPFDCPAGRLDDPVRTVAGDTHGFDVVHEPGRFSRLRQNRYTSSRGRLTVTLLLTCSMALSSLGARGSSRLLAGSASKRTEATHSPAGASLRCTFVPIRTSERPPDPELDPSVTNAAFGTIAPN